MALWGTMRGSSLGYYCGHSSQFQLLPDDLTNTTTMPLRRALSTYYTIKTNCIFEHRKTALDEFSKNPITWACFFNHKLRTKEVTKVLPPYGEDNSNASEIERGKFQKSSSKIYGAHTRVFQA